MRRLAPVLLLFAWAGALAADAVEVALRVSASAHGPNVLLADVLEGLPAEAASVVLKPSGLPGGSVRIDAGLVGLKLRRAPGGPYQLGGAAACEVSVPAQTLPGETVRSFAREYLEKRLSGTAGASLEPLGKVADLKLYDPPVRLECSPLDDADLRGNVVLRIRALQAGPDGREREAGLIPVSFLVRRKEARLAASQVIRKGDKLGPQNLVLREEDATFVDRGFGGFDEVEGKSARAYIGAGKTLTRSMVEFPPLVKRGDIVRVLVRSGGVVVEGTGKALRDAREGESIPVQMENTKKQMQARCVEAGVVVYEAR